MFTLPKTKLLRKRGEFTRIYHDGVSYANRYMVMYVLPEDTPIDKVGFAAGKKLGCAVVRNRLKRLLRECYRLHRHELSPRYTILLVARHSLVGESYAVAEKAFLSLAARAKILPKKKFDVKK